MSTPHRHYGPGRATWAGDCRDDIPSRQHAPYQRPEPFIGRIMIALPGFDLDWTLRQDMRDMRRFRAVDLDGIVHAHRAPREMLREDVLRLVPVYAGMGG